jgi:ABC-2 type transport system ATP-binding protein
MSPSAGSVSYFNKSLHEHRSEILKRVNYMSGYSKMPWRMSVQENLNVFAHLYEVSNPRQKIETLASRFEVTDQLSKKFRDLSAGQSTRVLLVKAFMNDPELVLLDEPTASLDPDIAQKIRSFISEERKRRQMSILITSHNMAEVEELCDRVIFLNHGKVYAIDTPEKLARRNTQCELRLMIVDGLKRLTALLEKEQASFQESERFVTVKLLEGEIGPLLTKIGKKGIEYSDIEIIRPSLEDFFLSVAEEGI